MSCYNLLLITITGSPAVARVGQPYRRQQHCTQNCGQTTRDGDMVTIDHR